MNGFLKLPKVSQLKRYSAVILLGSIAFSLVSAPEARAEIALFDLIFKTKKTVGRDIVPEASMETVSAIERPVALKTIRMASTAYSSRAQETDSSPFITADGSVVSDGVVATNVLPFGTKVRLPTIFGDKIFVVHDRMNARYSYRIDVWMENLPEAKRYGIKRNIPVEVIEMGNGKKSWDQWKGRSSDLYKVGKYGPPAPPLAQPYIAKADNES